MTFPSTLKKSGPITISKTGTGSGSKSLSPGLSRSPVSPSVKMVASGSSSVKPYTSNKTIEKTSVLTTVKKASISLKNPASKSVIDVKSEKASLKSPTSKSVTKPLIGVKSETVSLKSPTSKSVTKPVIDAKSESVKTVTSAIKVVAKTAIKPPPLKLNLKVIDTSGLQKSPVISKFVPKTPTTPSSKKPATLTKSSPTVTNSLSAVKSPLLSAVKSLSSLNKPSNALTMTGSVDTKSSTVVKSTSKSSTSTVTKSPKVSVLSKASSVSPPVKTLTSVAPKTTVSKSPQPSTKPLSLTVKSLASKTVIKENSVPLKSLVQSKAVIVKPTIPVKKPAVLSTKNDPVKLLATTSKSTSTPKSPSIVSSFKTISSKVPNSPSKLLCNESKSVKTTNSLTSANKSNVISKSGPAAPKAIVNKEPSTSSAKTSLVKSTSPVVTKPTTLKTKVTSSTVIKNLVPKSPITKARPLAVPSSPTVKTPSPIVKTPMSPALKTGTSSSPTVRPRTTSISAKPPMSPARPKLLPTKLLLSPTKSERSSSRLNSMSTESSPLRTLLKSPMSPKSVKFVPKSPSKVIKKLTEASVPKTIRGGQPIQKTIIPQTNVLPANEDVNQSETPDVYKKENVVQNDCKVSNQSTVPETCNQTPFFEASETVKTEVNIDDGSKTTNTFVYDDVSLNAINAENIVKLIDGQEHNLKAIEEATVAYSSLPLNEQKQDENLLDFEVVTKDECVPHLNSISQSPKNCDILFDDNHFCTSSEDVIVEHLDEETQSCTVEMYEPMNDKLVLDYTPFESDNSDCEQPALMEEIEIEANDEVEQTHCVSDADDVFVFNNAEDLSNLDGADSDDNFIHQFMPKSVEKSEGASSISTDDGSFTSRKSYLEAVVGSSKEFYFDYGSDLADDSLDYDDESSVFVEITDKEFPELKPKDLSCKRRNKKQKKRNCSNGTELPYDSNSFSEETSYDPNDFEGNEFRHYIQMMKDCSFYPNGLFCSDSVKLSTSSSLSWLDISVRTTDDDLIPSTESLSTYQIFEASNLNKDFLMSVFGCTNAVTPSNESSWSWKSIEGRHQSHIKTNITLSLQPRPKHFATPRFMLLLALISEAKGYEIQPSLSEHFVTTDCMPRFDHKIRRLMVQGFWMVGRLIKESLSEDEEINCGNPFGFVDGDIGYWWGGVNMLDWQEYLKECGKSQELSNCYQFVIEKNIDGKRYNSSEALSSMGVSTPEEFMSESDVDNFIHSVRNVKYYCGNCFVDSEENLEEAMNEDSCDDNDLVEWGKETITQQN